MFSLQLGSNSNRFWVIQFCLSTSASLWINTTHYVILWYFCWRPYLIIRIVVTGVIHITAGKSTFFTNVIILLYGLIHHSLLIGTTYVITHYHKHWPTSSTGVSLDLPVLILSGWLYNLRFLVVFHDIQ